jgi:dihydromonapterin reductase/dihydrofolate reductase
VSNAPILVTGVGRRIGFHLARTFQERGIPVIGTYRTERSSLDDLREAGAELHRCDFTDDEQIERFTRKIAQSHETLRAIIHNASDWLPEGNGRSEGETMQRMMQVHVSAPYQINLALAPLLQAGDGRMADIIHIGDYVSGRGSTKHIAYAASKAAQDNLTLSFAALLAPNVKVNSIAPALILFNDHDDAEYRQKALSKSLIQHEGGLDEFQHNVDYLLDSRYVTGRIVHLDGGRHLVSS